MHAAFGTAVLLLMLTLVALLVTRHSAGRARDEAASRMERLRTHVKAVELGERNAQARYESLFHKHERLLRFLHSNGVVVGEYEAPEFTLRIETPGTDEDWPHPVF